MNAVRVSAPGKLMLLGEHAVVYNHPCLVTAVGQRMQVTIEPLKDAVFALEAPDVNISGYRKPMPELGKGDIPKSAAFVETAVRNFLKEHKLPGGIRVTTNSEFSALFGFGSSSAATVCVLKGLAHMTAAALSDRGLFDLSYKTVLDIQGKGSGFDVAAAIYGGTLFFVTGGTVIEPIPLPGLPLVIGYSGSKADTVTLIKAVAEKAGRYPDLINEIYRHIERLVTAARSAMEQGNWQTTGELMNLNQGLLETLGVSSGKLAAMIYAARGAGAYGAKLSGAGVGDCMIALASDKTKPDVCQAITNADGKVIDIPTNVPGVRVE